MDFTNELKLDGLQAQLEEESKMRKEGSFEKERSGRASRVNADDILIKKDKYRRSRSESTGRSQEERIRNRSRTRDDGGESSHKVWSRDSSINSSPMRVDSFGSPNRANSLQGRTYDDGSGSPSRANTVSNEGFENKPMVMPRRQKSESLERQYSVDVHENGARDRSPLKRGQDQLEGQLERLSLVHISPPQYSSDDDEKKITPLSPKLSDMMRPLLPSIKKEVEAVKSSVQKTVGDMSNVIKRLGDSQKDDEYVETGEGEISARKQPGEHLEAINESPTDLGRGIGRIEENDEYIYDEENDLTNIMNVETQCEEIIYNTKLISQLQNDKIELAREMELAECKFAENTENLRREHRKEIDSLARRAEEDSAVLQNDILDRDRNIKILREEKHLMEKQVSDQNISTERVSMELTRTRDALHKSVATMEELKAEQGICRAAASRLEDDNERKDAELRELQRMMETLMKENASLRANVQTKRSLDDLAARKERLIGVQIAQGRKIRAESSTTSIASSIMTISKDDEREVNMKTVGDILALGNEKRDDDLANAIEESNRGNLLSPDEARKRLKSFVWPDLSKFDSADTFRRMFSMQVNAAQSEGIPDGLIKNAIQQHLLKGNTAQVFAQLCGKMGHDTLYDILELLNFVDPMEQCLSEEERFKEIRCNAEETAVSFMNRIEVAFRDLFGSNATGESRRIKRQFLDGFRKKGISLDDQEKEFLMMNSNLVDLAIATDNKFKVKLEKFKEKQSQGQQAKGPPRQNYRGGPSGVAPNHQTQNRQSQMASGAIPKSINVVTQGGDNQNGAAGQQERRPRLISAGPHAERIKLHEYENMRTDDNQTFCRKCLQKGHYSGICRYVSACIYCGGREVYHSSNYHNEVMNKMADDRRKREEAGQEEPRISMNNLE